MELEWITPTKEQSQADQTAIHNILILDTIKPIGIKTDQRKSILMSCLEYLKFKLCGVQITFVNTCQVVTDGYFGTVSLGAAWHGQVRQLRRGRAG